MKPTIPENKILDVSKLSTAELDEFDCEEITENDPVMERCLEFSLSDKDVELVNEVAEEQGISYDSALHMVLRDAMDLYHWNRKRLV